MVLVRCDSVLGPEYTEHLASPESVISPLAVFAIGTARIASKLVEKEK